MKHCSTCNRTYPDDSLNFCLADGSFLSSPDDPQITVANPVQRPTDAPTEILSNVQATTSKHGDETQPASVIAQTNIETSQRRKPRLLLWIVCGIILIGITALIAQNINSSKENSSNSGISSENTTANSNRVKPLIIEDEITPTGEVSKPSQANSNVGLNNRPKVSIPPIINGNADPIVHGDPRSKSTETPNASNKSEGKIVSGEAPDPNKVYMPSEVTQKARILSRPEPQYTEEARKNQVSGTVVLRIVLSSSGQVTNISAISGLPYGLTERAIAAARQLRFSPAMKDGHPISQYAQIEYNFNLY